MQLNILKNEMDLCIGAFYIRDFRPDDIQTLYGILSDPAVMEYIEPPYSYEKTAVFLQVNGLDTPRKIYALADKNDSVIGQIIFHPYEKDAWEIGWILHESCWGRGIATAVTLALVERCREMGVSRCVIECDPAQSVTRHIAEICGFSRIEDRDGLACYSLMLL